MAKRCHVARFHWRVRTASSPSTTATCIGIFVGQGVLHWPPFRLHQALIRSPCLISGIFLFRLLTQQTWCKTKFVSQPKINDGLAQGLCICILIDSLRCTSDTDTLSDVKANNNGFALQLSQWKPLQRQALPVPIARSASIASAVSSQSGVRLHFAPVA